MLLEAGKDEGGGEAEECGDCCCRVRVTVTNSVVISRAFDEGRVGVVMDAGQATVEADEDGGGGPELKMVESVSNRSGIADGTGSVGIDDEEAKQEEEGEEMKSTTMVVVTEVVIVVKEVTVTTEPTKGGCDIDAAAEGEEEVEENDAPNPTTASDELLTPALAVTALTSVG